MTNKLNNTKKIGFEIKIKVNNTLIQSGWFTKKCINVGDSHLFPLLFPIPEAQDSNPRNPQEINQIKNRGIKLRSCFSTKTGNRIYSFGFPLIRKSSSGDYKLRILKKMKATVDGENFNNQTREYRDITLEPLAEGTIYGKDEWTLEFRWVDYKPHQFEKNPVVTPFFGQALIYSFILVFGLLYLGFLEKKDLEIDFDHTSHSKRLVRYEKRKKKKEKETIIEEKVEEINNKPVLKTALLNRKIQRKTKKLATPKKIELKFLFDKNKNNSPISNANTPGSENSDLDQEGEGEETTQGDNQESSGLANAGNAGNTGLPATTPSFDIKTPPQKAVKAPPRIKVRPKRKFFPAISYPESAKYLGIEGKVRLMLFIDEDGKIYKVKILTKLHPMLNRAAVAGARKAKYKPALDQYGKPIKSKSIISIRFKIEEEEF